MPLAVCEVVGIFTVSVLSMLAYSRLSPKYPFLEFLAYSVPQYLVWRYGTVWTHIGLIGVMLIVPRKYHRTYPEGTSSVERARMAVSFVIGLSLFGGNFHPVIKAIHMPATASIGSFVYCAGLVSSRTSRQEKVRSACKSIALAVGRYVMKNVFNVPTQRPEINWCVRLFLCLAMLNLLATVGAPPYPFACGLGLVVGQQLLVSFACCSGIGDCSGQGVLTARNISFLVSQFGLYLMGRDVAAKIDDKRPVRRILPMVFIAVVALGGMSLIEPTDASAYLIISTDASAYLIIFIAHTLLLLLIEITNRHFNMCDLDLSRFGSRMMLSTLVLTNVLMRAGRVREYFNEVSELRITAKIGLYLFFTFYVMFKVDRFLQFVHGNSISLVRMPIK